MKVTVIIPCWKRFKNFEKVIQSWLAQDEVDQVIVWDNSGQFRTKLPVLVLSSNQNLGAQAKYACGQLAKNDLVLFSDDDVIAKKGLVSDLMKCRRNGSEIVGIVGRNFTGKSYYDSTAYHGSALKNPVKVDYLCGLVMLTSRKHCLVDIRECPSTLIDDWWWQQEIKKVSLWVAPTKNYELLPEGKTDEHALHLKPELKEMREKYYKKWVKNV